jgi:hypothetical protein
MGAVPVAATLKEAVCPAMTFALAGWDEIVGATAEFEEMDVMTSETGNAIGEFATPEAVRITCPV